MAIGIAVYFAFGARESRLVTDPNYSWDADEAARARQSSPTIRAAVLWSDQSASTRAVNERT